jgi:Mn-dependent DtxR family transcriptional regulator
MSIETMVLRAMLRIARRREAADEEALSVRVRESPAAVRAAMRRLEAAGAVERRPGLAPRLTMAGLAAAVALLPAPSSRGALPAARRSRAA